MPGLPARQLAAETFRRVLAERRGIDEALLAAGRAELAIEDAGLARAIVTTAFRRLGTIRRAFATRLAAGGALPEAGRFTAIVTTGAAQVLFMTAADHAAVDLAVELVKRDRASAHLAGLANALLRRIAREKMEILADAAADPVDLPGWLAERWTRAYGAGAVEAIAASLLAPPSVDLTAINITADRLQAAIGGRLLPTGSLRLSTDRPISELPGYAEGHFQVQDVAAALPARLIGAHPGDRVLDLCAAPGGKTAQLAAAGATVTAVERGEARAARLRENLARLRLSAEVVVGDMASFAHGGYDAVLLDAPCTATGTIRRHPEIGWIRALSDILALAETQGKLLAAAARNVRPGGRLVFATCSLEPEEGERRIEAFLTTHAEFSLERVLPEELGAEAAIVASQGWLRVLPSHFAEAGGADGFFAARLRRAG